MRRADMDRESPGRAGPRPGALAVLTLMVIACAVNGEVAELSGKVT